MRKQQASISTSSLRSLAIIVYSFAPGMLEIPHWGKNMPPLFGSVWKGKAGVTTSLIYSSIEESLNENGRITCSNMVPPPCVMVKALCYDATFKLEGHTSPLTFTLQSNYPEHLALERPWSAARLLLFVSSRRVNIGQESIFKWAL